MGRYYNGDVNGKFMFAVQSSNAHERFGAEEMETGTFCTMFGRAQLKTENLAQQVKQKVELSLR